MSSFTVNERTYQPPGRPVVGICLDGSADEYLDAALARGRMPYLERMSVQGFRGFARGQMPSFTNVNNASIVTGVPPSVHGIGGNFFYDTASGQEVMTNSAKFLRVETIFPAAQRAGRKVAVVTAKDKLRDIFASGLIGLGGIAFSSEKANQATMPANGVADVEALAGLTPPIYSGAASLYVLQAGVKLLEQGRADFLYLSTTDYMQHKFAPEAPEALDFYAGMDEQLGRLLELGALVGVTADHGMNAKQRPDGSPNVIYLESTLENEFGPGFRVILPITDPYVVHHGALGSFAQVHLPPGQGPLLGVHAVIGGNTHQRAEFD
jgi:phosphonoacetate hydrolase